MADLSRSVVLNILGDNSDAKRKIDEINAKADALDKRNVTLHIMADDGRLNTTLADANTKLTAFGRRTDTGKLEADDRGVNTAVADASAKMTAFGRRKDTSTLDANAKPFDLGYAEVTAKMAKLARSSADAKLGEKGGEEVLTEIDILERKLKDLNDTKADPSVDLEGYIKTKAEIDSLKASLDSLQRESDRLNLGTGISSLMKALSPGGGSGGSGNILSRLLSGGGEGGSGSIFSRLSGIGGTAGTSLGSIGGSPLGLGAIGIGVGSLLSLLPGLAGGSIGIAGGLGLLGGQQLANAGSANILAQDHAAVAAAQNAQQRAQAQATLHGDAQTARNLSTEAGTLAQLGDTIGAAFTPSALQVNKILLNMQPVVSKLGDMLKQMFQASLPFLNQFLQFLGKAGEVLLPAFTQAMVAMRPAFPIMTEGFLAIVKGIAGFIEALGPGMKSSAIIFKGVGIVIEAVLKGLGWLFANIANAWEGAFHIINIAIKDMVIGFEYLGKNIAQAGVAMWHGIVDVGHGIAAAWDGLVNVAKAVGHLLVAAWAATTNGIAAGAEGFWHLLVRVWDSISAGVVAAWNVMWNLVKSVANASINFIVSAASAFWHGLVKVWDAIATGVESAWNTMWNLLKAVANAAISFITGAATTFWHWIVNAWNAIYNALANIWNTMWNLLKSVANAAINFIVSIATAFWHAIVNIWNSIFSTLSNVWNTMWNDLKNLANNGINAIQNAASAFWHWIVNTWNTIYSDVTSIFSRMWNDLQNAARTAVGILSNIIHGIENVFEVPIKFVVDNLWDPFAGLFNKVTSAVGVNISLPTIHLAEGGPVPGPRGAGDVIPAMLTPGEHVLTVSQVQMAGGHSAVLQMFGGGQLHSPDNFHFASGGAPLGFGGSGGGNATPSAVAKQAATDIAGVSTPGDINTGSIFSALSGVVKDVAGFLGKIANWTITQIENNLFGPLLNAIPDTGYMYKILKAIIKKILDAIVGKIHTQAQASGPNGGPAGQGVSGGEMANGRQIYEYLLANVFGGAKVAAAGATASIWGESTWNPFAQGTGGRGLIGWTPPGTISDAAFSGGMATQLPAIIRFISTSGDWGVIAAMKGATSVGVAAEQWGRGVERYGIDDVHSEGVALATSFMANGGIINEPILGMGLRSGSAYSFGEQGPEWVTPFGRGPNYGGNGGDIYNIYPPDSANNPDAYALTLIQAIRDYKRHHGGQATNIG